MELGRIVILSLSPWLIPWSAEAHLAHSPAWASKTLSRRHPVPSPPLERAPSAFVRDASPVSRTLLVFCVNQRVSASSLFHFLIFASGPPGLSPLCSGFGELQGGGGEDETRIPKGREDDPAARIAP